MGYDGGDDDDDDDDVDNVCAQTRRCNAPRDDGPLNEHKGITSHIMGFPCVYRRHELRRGWS